MKVTIVALSGIQGSGKDTIADRLKELGFRQHFFAAPMYKIAKLSKQITDGDVIASYDLFDLAVDLFGGRAAAPPFEVTSAVVSKAIPELFRSTSSDAIMSNGAKPREFLQKIGDMFRSFDEDIYCNYLVASVMSDTRKGIDFYLDRLESFEAGRLVQIRAQDLDDKLESEDETPIVDVSTGFELNFVISDMRFPREAKALAELSNKLPKFIRPDLRVRTVFVKLDVPVDVAVDRVVKRDGSIPEVVRASLNHNSEQGLPDDIYDLVIDGTKPVDDIVLAIRRVISGEGEYSDIDTEPSIELPLMEGGVIDLSQYSKRKGENNG